MSSGLGFRSGERAMPVRAPAPMPAPMEEGRAGFFSLSMPTVPAILPAMPAMPRLPQMPTGIVPTFACAAFAAFIPIMMLFGNVDYTEDAQKAAIIGTSVAFSGVTAMAAMSPETLHNIALFLHLGFEIKVVDTGIKYADRMAGDDTAVVLAWSAVIVIIVHLLPFFLVNHGKLLGALAVAGVGVNTALLTYVDTSLVLVVFVSSILLLLSTLNTIVCGCKTPAMLTILVNSCKTGSFFM